MLDQLVNRVLFESRKTSVLGAIEVASVDLNQLRRDGTTAEKYQMAERIFRVWQPLFAHLAEKDPSFHLKLHIDDDTAVWKRVWFYRRGGEDLGAVIGRVHEHELDGATFFRITMNAGLDPELIGANIAGATLAKTVVAAMLLARGRPVYIIDGVSSPPALAAMVKGFPSVRPSADGACPPSLWKFALAAAPALGCVPVEGKPLGIVRSHAVISAKALSSTRPRSVTAQRMHQWFSDNVGPGESLLVICPVTPSYALSRMVQWAIGGLQKSKVHSHKGDQK